MVTKVWQNWGCCSLSMSREIYYCMWLQQKSDVSLLSTDWRAARARSQCLHVPVLRLLYHIRFILYPESVHWCHHWKLQSAEKKGNHNYTYIHYKMLPCFISRIMLHVLNLIIYKNKIDKCMHVKALILKTCIAEIEIRIYFNHLLFLG